MSAILSVKTAAQRAGFTERHMFIVVQRDQIPYFEIGQTRFIKTADFEAWQKQHNARTDHGRLKKVGRSA